MLKALKAILFALSGVLFCWIPPLFALYDTLQGDRGSFFECQRREWARWWRVNEQERA
jgi:hypothetical protein